jgi:hypothetical protein
MTLWYDGGVEADCREGARRWAAEILLERETGDEPFQAEVRGISMAPLLAPGDVVTLAPYRGRRPRVGDVALLAVNDRERFLHRIVTRRNSLYILKGDRARRPDHAAPAAAVRAHVVKVSRGGRTIVLTGGWPRLVGWAVAAVSRLEGVLTADERHPFINRTAYALMSLAARTLGVRP